MMSVAADSLGHAQRIAFVLPGLRAGGSERVVSILADYWAAQGRDVTVITFEEPARMPYFSIDPRVRLTSLSISTGRLSPLRAASRIIRRVTALRRTLHLLEPQVIISFLTRTNITSILAAWGSGIPVIVSERNNATEQTVDPFWVLARAALYRRAYALVTMTRRSLESFPPSQRPRGRVIPNPVRLPGDLISKRDGRILVAAGRLIPQKGFDLLLDAFAAVSDRFPDWTLVIWGEGDERSSLEAQRDRLGLANRVRLPGISAKPGMWIESADAFVLSSRFEGWAMVITEAMAAGIPVVSFDCAFGPAEQIQHNSDGLLVPSGNVAALSEALARVMGDDLLRARLGNAAKLKARDHAPERIAAAWDALLDEALAEHARQNPHRLDPEYPVRTWSTASSDAPARRITRL